MDCISNMPDEILGKILSLLPTKTAASTSVLSQRWKNLLLLVENLDFDESMYLYFRLFRDVEDESSNFSGFVDKTLSLNTLIKKFSLKCVHIDDRNRVNRWIRTALQRGCSELNLIHSSVELLVDSSLFTSDKLVKLTFSDGFFLDGGYLFLPSLKTLSLVADSFDMIKFFIDGCPKLEELSLRVVLRYSGFKVRTPSLVVSDSLVEARLDIRVAESDFYDAIFWNGVYGNVFCLLNGLSNVKTLHLSPYSQKVFLIWPMPVLDKLLSLTIESDVLHGWEVLPGLLDKSPNLQRLVIKGLVHRVTEWCGDACACIPMKDEEKVCCLLSSRVKVVEISGYKGTFEELKQMRHFLKNLEYLEIVKVGIEKKDMKKKKKNIKYLRANIMAITKASSKCKIQFI